MVDCMNVAASAAGTVKFVPSRSRHSWAFGAATLPLISALALSPALAQNFTVVAGPPVGQQVMNNIGDVGVIEAGGTISTTDVDAVQMLAADQMLENFGLIATSGAADYGIYSSAEDATINNFGTISTAGVNAFAIFSIGANATITNSGTVSTTEHNGDGITSTGPNATVTNSGSISTTGNLAEGIYLGGADATVTNFGTISTTGTSAEGIYANGPTATVTNSGSVSTAGGSANAIFSTDGNATISNSGSVSTAGSNSFAIASEGANATIANLGTINTTGSNSHAIYSHATAANATITNSGSIATTGLGSYGIVSQGIDATIINSGSIATTDFAFAIRSGGDYATIINSGTITTANNDANGIVSTGLDAVIMNSGSISTGAIGIRAYQAGATITNSGSIISETADAIFFDQGDANLNLLAGSVINGGITFTGTDNTVSFGPGLNTLLTFSGAGIPGTILTSGNPYAVSGTTIAVLDRGGFALADDMALTLAGDVAGMTGGRGQCLVGEVPSGDDESCASKAWLAGFGGFGGRSDSSDLAGYDFASGGALAGLEFTPGSDVSGGIFLGAMAAQGSVGESEDTTQSGGVVGGHAGFAQGGYFADFYAALGVLQIDSERTVADNTVDGGLAFASASEAGYFFSPAVTIGTELETGAGTLTPSLRLRYTGLMLDGYAESGADDAVVVDERLVHELELRAQLALALTPSEGEAGTLSAVLRAGADIVDRQSDTITGALLGQDIAFTSGEDGTAYRGFAALDLDLALSGGTSLFGNVELGLDNAGGYSATAHAGFSGAF